MTHDWPAGITDYGDVQSLLKIKPYFREDIERNQLGNPATMDLLHVCFVFFKCDILYFKI